MIFFFFFFFGPFFSGYINPPLAAIMTMTTKIKHPDALTQLTALYVVTHQLHQHQKSYFKLSDP